MQNYLHKNIGLTIHFDYCPNLMRIKILPIGLKELWRKQKSTLIFSGCKQKSKLMVYLASDHAGFHLKEVLKEYLEDMLYEVTDMGTYSEKACDYPDFVIPAAQAVARHKGSLGIVLGGSGQGEAIAANKVRGIRAVVYNTPNPEIIILSKEHNDANVLSLGARFLKTDEAKAAVKLWLETPFSRSSRHIRRLRKISQFEKMHFVDDPESDPRA